MDKKTVNFGPGMNKVAIRACPICDNSAAEILHSQKFVLHDSHPLANGYDVVSCTVCGMVYADTGSSQRAYDALYQDASKYQDNKTSTGGGESVWDAERLAETARTISSIAPDKTIRILDIGCANGGLLEALRALGYVNLTGIDPAPICAANTRHRGFDAQVGSLSSIPREVQPFDLVILSHVLEHVRELRTALAGLRRLLHESSLVYIEVPDGTRYCEFIHAPFQDFNTEHINHFSGSCLDNLTQQYGLSPTGPCIAKVVKSSLDTLYPAVFGVYRYGNAAADLLTKDESLKTKIQQYIALSSDLMQSMNERLLEELAHCSEVALWGTGQLAMKLLNDGPLRTANIRACVDGNPVNQGKQLRGIPILAPNQLNGIDCPIVITTTLHETEIRRNIHALGISNRLVSLRIQESVQ
jgi:SAM-dependent methyltransferase